MRRYLISHFREPIDIASSSLGEKHAIYGGGPNLKMGIKNVINKYHPRVIGVATTCLTETIGDDAPMLINEFKREEADFLKERNNIQLVTVSTPSYSGTHMDGFHAAVRETVRQLTGVTESTGKINVFPGLLSPADIRYLKETLKDFGLQGIILPDISETLDGPAVEDYIKVPEGGTPLEDIKSMGGSRASLEFGTTLAGENTAGSFLEERFKTPLYSLGTPIGLRQSDLLFDALAEISGKEIPRNHALERGRLIDAYVDGHKYIFGKRVIVYGEEDLVIGLTAFLSEIGASPVLCASGGRSGKMKEAVKQLTASYLPTPPAVREGADFFEIAELADELHPDLLIGASKAYRVSRKRDVPLVRVGFPIHDRFGGQRILHIGYRGAQYLYDRIVNAILEKNQEDSPIGYGYQ